MLRVAAPHDVWQVLAPCEIVCKCLGLIPVFCGQDLHTWKRWANFVHLIITVVLLSRGVTYCVPLDLSGENISAVFKQSEAIMIVLFYIQPIFSVTYSRLVAGNIHQILTTIKVVDSKFMFLDAQKYYAKERNIVFGLSASAFSACPILFAIYSTYSEIDVEYTVETIIFQLHYSMTCVYATSISFITLKRFCMLNKSISEHFPCSQTLDADLSVPTYHEKSSKIGKHVLLKQMKIVLDKMIRTVDFINHCFAMQVLFCVGMCFVIGVFCSFHITRSLMYHHSDELFLGGVNLIWYMYYLFYILVFIAVGSRLASESKRIGVFVHKAINSDSTSTVVSNELLIFSQQLLHHSPVITCGLFVYDWSLFYTIISATATYLIILVQFDFSFPSLVDVTGNGSMVD